jgi:hypothetical protein
VNSTVLIAISSSLTAASAIAGIFLQSSDYLKYGAASVVVVSTLITVFQAILNERSTAFTKRSLTNLIRSVRPSEYVRDAVFGAISKEAVTQGMPFMHVAGFESQKYILQFGADGHENRVGVLCLSPERISELSLYDPAGLQSEVKKLCANPFQQQTPRQCWKELANEITLISELVFAYHKRKVSTVKLWADYDKEYLAVGPPDCSDDTPPHERAEFPKSTLQNLVGLSALLRGAAIANSVEHLVMR